MTGASVETARAAWGASLPDWLLVFAEHCDGASQSKASRAIGYSPAVGNAVLQNKYKGNLGRVELAVRGRYMRTIVGCPVLGEIRTDQCMSEQRRKLESTNPTRVRLYRACRAACPHSRIGGNDDQ